MEEAILNVGLSRFSTAYQAFGLKRNLIYLRKDKSQAVQTATDAHRLLI